MAKYKYEQAKRANPDKEPKRLNSHLEWGVLPNEFEAKMADTICTDWAVEFLTNSDHTDKPFFLGFGLYAPHKPNFVPQKYFKLHPLSEVEMVKMHPGDLNDLPPLLKKRTLARKKRDDQVIRDLKCGKKAVRGYLAALSYADAMVGRVLDALQRSPHADNTIVVLWSDNGYHLGEKGCWAKHTLWERTSNVPYIWAGPGIAKGETVSTSASLLDTYPTLLDLCALPKNEANEGVSLMSVLKDPQSAKDRTVLQCNNDSFSLINATWRYTRYGNGEEELYHVAEDPEEHDNVAADDQYATTIADFRRRLPVERSQPALGPKSRTLKLKFKGDSFQWVRRETVAR